MGGVLPALLARRALAVPGGGFPSLSPAAPTFRLLFCPYPPVPLPSGKGETKVILCKGLRPLHPRGLNPGGTGEGWRLTRRRGARQFWSPDCPADMVPKGGLPPRSPACPAFIVFPAPIPPAPFPAGRGRLLVYFAGGWRPRHPCAEPLTALTDHAIQASPRGAEPGRHWLRSTTHSGKFWGVRGTLSRVPRRLFAPIPGGWGTLSRVPRRFSPLKRRGKCDREPFCAGYRGGQSRRGGSRI